MKITQMIIVRLGFVQTGKWIFRMARTPPCQTRPQSVRYFCPADEATTALEESKTETWFRFNCACVKLFTHLTKKSSQGKFSLLTHCYNLLFPKQFFFLSPLVDVFGEERQVIWKDCLRSPKMYIYLNTTNKHYFVSHDDIHSFVLRMSTTVGKFEGLPRCKNLWTLSLFCTFCFLGLLCWLLCFLCFTSPVSLTGSYTQDEPNLEGSVA